jgi:tetratricopeptide (TPR) repeat protein
MRTAVLQSYSSKDNFKEGMTDIYSALAANSLANLSRSRDKKRRDEYATQLMEYFRKAEYYMRVNEYIWLIKGFYHLHMGEFKHAEDIFKAIHDRATKNNALVKKKFLFGALVGLGIVAYCLKKYVVSLDDFIKVSFLVSLFFCIEMTICLANVRV